MKKKNLIKGIVTFFTLLFCSLCFSAEFLETTPTIDFIDNKDGTVTHKKTGLTWDRCVYGQEWTGETCDYRGDDISYYSAQEGLNRSNNDWRLPTITELLSIVEYNNSYPAINNVIFPNTPISKHFSETIIGEKIIELNFSNGMTYDTELTNNVPEIGKYSEKAFVRFVKGKKLHNELVDNNDGTVTDKTTGLTWQKCSVGQNWNNSTCEEKAKETDFYEAIKEKSTLAGYSDWRLPRITELQSIIEYQSKSGINEDMFPNTSLDGYYLSTTGVFLSNKDKQNPKLKTVLNNIWTVHFDAKQVFPMSKDNSYRKFYVRLVRGGQPLLENSLLEKKPDEFEKTKEPNQIEAIVEASNRASFGTDKEMERLDRITKKNEEISKKLKEKKPKSTSELCTDFAGIAELIMSIRQHGGDVSKLMADFEGNKLAESLIIDAYDKSRFSSAEYQNKAIGDFKNTAYLSCIKGFK